MTAVPPPGPRPDETGTPRTPDTPPGTASVRLALPTEASAIACLQRRVWGDDPDLTGLLTDVDEETMTRAWWEAITRPPLAELRVLVATEPGPEGPELRGFAATGPSEDDDAVPHDGQLGEFLVDPEHLGRGHGSRLLNAVVDTLRADGFTRATMWLRSTDDALRTFLTSAGWGPDGAHRETGTEDEQVRVKEIRLHTLIGDDVAATAAADGPSGAAEPGDEDRRTD